MEETNSSRRETANATIDTTAEYAYRLRIEEQSDVLRRFEMWAQLISMRLKPGGEANLPKVIEQLRAIEQPDSGLLRSITMRDQNDPNRVLILVVFENEEKARAREGDPRRQEGLQAVRATMADVFEGAPEFVDLSVIEETTP